MTTLLGHPLLELVTAFVMVLLTLAMCLVAVRLWRGPTLPDRVIAVDLIATIAVGLIATYAIATDQAVFMDAAIVLALIAFLGTIAFARYLEKRAHK